MHKVGLCSRASQMGGLIEESIHVVLAMVGGLLSTSTVRHTSDIDCNTMCDHIERNMSGWCVYAVLSCEYQNSPSGNWPYRKVVTIGEYIKNISCWACLAL